MDGIFKLRCPGCGADTRDGATFLIEALQWVSVGESKANTNGTDFRFTDLSHSQCNMCSRADCMTMFLEEAAHYVGGKIPLASETDLIETDEDT